MFDFDEQVQKILKDRIAQEEAVMLSLLDKHNLSLTDVRDGDYHLANVRPRAGEEFEVLKDDSFANDSVTFKPRKTKFILYKKIDEVEG